MLRRFSFMLLALLVAGLFVACGDTTPTPAASSGQSTTPAKTTEAVTQLPAIPTAAPVAPTSATTLAATTAAATAAADAPRQGGILRLSTTQDGQTIHPYKAINSFSRTIAGFLFGAALTRRDPKTLEVVGLAAKSWTVDKNSKTVTFTLRDGITWSDGTPITSADYIFTFEQLKKKENAYPYLAQLVADTSKPNTPGIVSAEAPDSKTIKITLQTITYDIVQRAELAPQGPLPKHIWEGKDWNDPTQNPEVDKPTVVSGPWQLKEWVRNERISLVRNDKSTVRPVPLLDGITYSFVPDTNVAYLKLKQGELDLYSPEAKDFSDLKNQPNLQAYSFYPAQASWEYVGFNFRKPYLKDLALRQAMAYATDKDGIIEKVQFGLARAMYSNVPSNALVYNDSVEKYAFNMDKAKQVLKEAGYTLKDGKLYDKSGQKIPELKFYFDAPAPEREKEGQILQQAWSDLGLDVKTFTQPFDAVRKTLTTEPYDYDVWLRAWGAGYDQETAGSMWYTPTLNYGAYQNEELSKLYQVDILNELDTGKRKEFLQKTQLIESKELPYIYLYYVATYFGANKKLAGINPTLAGYAYNQYTDFYFKS